MKTCLIVILCSCFVKNLPGQISSTYQTETIYLQLNTYVKNERAYPIGFMSGKLKREMEVSREAMVVFKRHQNQRKLSLVLSGAGLISQAIGLSMEPGLARNTLIGGGLACAIISFPFTINADRNLNRAVWVRNGEVLTE